MEKKKITLSLPIETIKKLEDICKENGTQKSSMIALMINNYQKEK